MDCGQGQPSATDHAGGVHLIIRLLRRRQEARPIEPSRKVNPRRAELETAKEILAEIFGVRAMEVEEMIRSRMEERSWAIEQTHEDGLWPAAFCLGECMGRSFESVRMSAKDPFAASLILHQKQSDAYEAGVPWGNRWRYWLAHGP